MTTVDDAWNEGAAAGATYAAEIRADERARCIKVLESLRVQTRGNAANMGVEAAIAALSEAPTPPVASSPVGGEQQ